MDVVILTKFQQHTPYSKQNESFGSKCNVFKSEIAATAGPNSFDIIRHEKSAEDAYLTKPIDGRIRIQLLLPYRTLTIESAYLR